ncbi:hypothetical protein AAEX63_07910 [Luteococcus sp. H138]|uniref:hypothetical protein n=1 Tax=unclassified Luteococcus TaxID=2639923 RepID=UPI00313A8A3D
MKWTSGERAGIVPRALRVVLWLVMLGILAWLARTGGDYQDGWWGSSPSCITQGTCTPGTLRAARQRLWLGAGLGGLLALGIVLLNMYLLPARRVSNPLAPWRALILLVVVAACGAALGLGWIFAGLVMGIQAAALWLVISSLLTARALYLTTREVERPRRHYLMQVLSVPLMIVLLFLLQVVVGSQLHVPFGLSLVLLALGWALFTWLSFRWTGGRMDRPASGSVPPWNGHPQQPW